MHSPAGSQQLADTMSSLQLSENVVQTECAEDATSSGEEKMQRNKDPKFPLFKLARLDEKISNARWIVPVLPGQELECLLKASIEMCYKGLQSNYNNLSILWIKNNDYFIVHFVNRN